MVIPFTDDEERILGLVRKIADHLRELRLSAEILAVDDDSRDNSAALLALLQPEVQELRVVRAGVRGAGLAAGARMARGRALWLVNPRVSSAPLAAFSWAHARIVEGSTDAVVVRGRYILCHRARTWELVGSSRGGRAAVERRFARRAMGAGLRVETPARAQLPPPARRGLFGRMLGSLRQTHLSVVMPEWLRRP